MKKSLWLIIPFILVSSTISFAQNQNSPSMNLLKKNPSNAQYHCSVAQNNFEQYRNLIGLSKENVLNTFSEKPYVIENGATFSGTGGGSGLIFKYDNSEYNLISRFTLLRSPIIISENTTNGWKDIIMYVSGGGGQSFFAEMKFDGTSYPLNPSMQPKLESGRVILGTAIIADL